MKPYDYWKRNLGVVLLNTVGALSQSVPQKPSPQPIRIRPMSFMSTKPVLGLPDLKGLVGYCSSDGDTYFNIYRPLSDVSGFETGADVYSVSKDADVKHLRRKLPVDFTDIMLLDFFPSAHKLVTLLSAEKWADDRRDGQLIERTYFLSLMEHDGSEAELVRLDVKFKPLRVAQFGSGDFLVFGWEPLNDLPIMAIMKPDGAVGRFVDSDDTQARGLLPWDIQSAKMLPFGDDVLLEYPYTAKPLRIMSLAKQDRVIPLVLAPGYVLSSVLVTSPDAPTIVARIVENPADDQKPHLLEFGTSGGPSIAEYTFEQVKTENVICAARSSLTAFFMEDVGDAPPASDGAKPKQLVVGTVRR